MTTYRPGTHHCAWCAGYASGAREALTEARRRVEALPVSRIVNLSTWDAVQVPAVLAAVDAAAAELGVEPTPDAGTDREQAGTSEPRWRCNRTERCFREDGHEGPHAFPGEPVSASPQRPAPEPPLAVPSPTPDTHSAPEAPCCEFHAQPRPIEHQLAARGYRPGTPEWDGAMAAARAEQRGCGPERKADQPEADLAGEHGETHP